MVIRAYALTVASRLAGRYPELAAGVIGALENVLIITNSAALRSRAARESPKLRDLVRELLPD